MIRWRMPPGKNVGRKTAGGILGFRPAVMVADSASAVVGCRHEAAVPAIAESELLQSGAMPRDWKRGSDEAEPGRVHLEESHDFFVIVEQFY